ncbi:MAG: energy transducer TonB [Thermosulfidibacteraceae bacterium]|jgi:TonB family protein
MGSIKSVEETMFAGILYFRRQNFTVFIVASILIHVLFAILMIVGSSISRGLIPFDILRRKSFSIGEREGVYYVKILDMPKPSKIEEPEEKNTPIISQYTTRKKGPMGVQEKSRLSGESPVMEYIPGVPYGTSSGGGGTTGGGGLGGLPAGGSGTGKAQGTKGVATGGGTSKSGTNVSGNERESKGMIAYKSHAETTKLQNQQVKSGKGGTTGSNAGGSASSGATSAGSGLPKERIPLIDPRLVDESAKKIVPQMGKGEMKGGVVEISLDARESKYISYFKKIRDRIYLVWRYPPEAAAAGIQGTVGIYFVLDRSGNIVEAYIIDSSGYAILDKTALNAIYRAAPFGPFPSDWGEKELRIRARFIYTIYSRSPF